MAYHVKRQKCERCGQIKWHHTTASACEECEDRVTQAAKHMAASYARAPRYFGP